MGLSQARKLIQTFPLLELSPTEKREFEELVRKKDARGVLLFLEKVKEKKRLSRWL